MPSATDFDFSGNYVFIASATYMHRLDESIRPLLEERGGQIFRIYTNAAPRIAAGDFALSALPADFFETGAVRAAFTTDAATPPDLVPPTVPLIALPHAFWFPRPQTEALLQDFPSYVGNADYYLTQDSADLPSRYPRPTSGRRKDNIYLLPFGSLKLDELRRRWLAETHKSHILYTCGKIGHADPLLPEEKKEFIDCCLQHFPQYDFVLRPFPGDRPLYDSLTRAFRTTKRFRIDSYRSTLQRMPSTAALLCDSNSTTGKLFSLATGQPTVFLPSRNMTGDHNPSNLFSPVRTPGEMIARLQEILALKGKENPALTAMREKLIFRPGHARELFFSYLGKILCNTVPQEAIAVPCDYTGDIRLPTATDEIVFFLRELRACRLALYHPPLRHFALYSALTDFYQKLWEGIQRQKTGMVSVHDRQGHRNLLVDTNCRENLLCPAPLSDYTQATQLFIQQHKHLIRTFRSLDAPFSILLPDKNYEVFCAALANVIEQAYGTGKPEIHYWQPDDLQES